MLTNGDLQAIQQIVSTVVKKEVKKEVKNEMRIGLKPIKKELKKIRSDLNVVITSFDTDITETKLRVDRIESELHLTLFVQ